MLKVRCSVDDNEGAYAIDTVEALQWLGDARTAMPKEVLDNCWRHTGLLSDRVMHVDHILN